MTEDELTRLAACCRDLPPAKRDYRINDYVLNLMLTVLDFQMHTRAVSAARHYFESHLGPKLDTHEDVKEFLGSYSNDEAGSTEAALILWGNRHWTRVLLLRALLDYLERATPLPVTNQRSLRIWAGASDYERDFKGKVRVIVRGRTTGLGYAVYNWLVMRQGVESIKPDVHIRRFVERCISSRCSDRELVDGLMEVALRLGIKAYELDWRIWEHERGG